MTYLFPSSFLINEILKSFSIKPNKRKERKKVRRRNEKKKKSEKRKGFISLLVEILLLLLISNLFSKASANPSSSNSVIFNLSFFSFHFQKKKFWFSVFRIFFPFEDLLDFDSYLNWKEKINMIEMKKRISNLNWLIEFLWNKILL